MKLFYLLDYISCSRQLLGDTTYEILYDYIFNGIRIAIPVLLVVLIMIDFFKATAAGDEKEMKKAQTDAIKRIVIGVVIVLLPTIVNILLNFVGLLNGRC